MDQSQLLKMYVEKPKKFKGSDFRRWQQEMLFYLTTLRAANILIKKEPPTNPPVGPDGDAPMQIQVVAHQNVFEICRSNKYSCKNYILNALNDSQYNIHFAFRTAREIWESLDAIYKTKVVFSKRFTVDKFLHYHMIDTKPMVKEVEELQVLVHELEFKGMGLNTIFVVSSITKKLPSFWKNFKLYLKPLMEIIVFEQLLLKILVEEDNRLNEKVGANVIEPHAIMIEGSSSKTKFLKFKGKKQCT
ncbi:uncharacterized protein LOC112523714 [Cynara cardunculus var. scolymus]|uniref:uncharacterized protein LOC112523714 n=1 Tax=Cynara cardunculus var. scolymus TaxID=59895 RepID=UPI000D624452|nr:uncharacterized protein LOC112523714 [Cynara cardunculus var. scolymus]